MGDRGMGVSDVSPVAMDAEDFLEVVWGDQEGWVDLPAKVNGYWVPFYAEWPADGTVSRRIDSSLRDREDLYYSVAVFSQRGRNIEHVLPSPWLWADLDEVHPTEGARLGFLPTIAVESSPGRYQALWRLTRELKPNALARLGQGLSYALEADRGGWDLTQVLRIPGTRNFKYPESPLVKVLWYREELKYDPKAIWAAVRESVPATELRAATGRTEGDLPKKAIPSRARALLRTPVENVVEGERSARLWELNCLLAESGLSNEEIYRLVWPCSWNKWRGRGSGSSGRLSLERDIGKAVRHVRRKRDLAVGVRPEQVVEQGDSGEDSVRQGDDPQGVSVTVRDGLDRAGVAGDGQAATRLPFVGYSSFMAMAMEEPKWLVEGIWTAGSHGIIGGEPKTQKTTLALALALSVASGAPLLGEFEVGVCGPVLMVQEENAPWMMQDRLRKLAAHAGLISKREVEVRRAGAGALGSTSLTVDFPADVPLRLLNNFGFDLGVDEHRDMLEAEVAALEPVLVILDPFYLILGDANENQSHELRPYLKWLLALRYQYNCAVAVIHHMRKAQAGGPVVRAGQRLMGNATLHGWVDSALYTSAVDMGGDGGGGREGWVKTRIEPEFRSMAPVRALELEMSLGLPGGLAMEAVLNRYDLGGVIAGMVDAEPGITVAELSARLDRDRRTVLSRVRGDGRFRVVGGKQGRGHSWKVYRSENRPEGADKEDEDG